MEIAYSIKFKLAKLLFDKLDVKCKFRAVDSRMSLNNIILNLKRDFALVSANIQTKVTLTKMILP